MRINKMLVAYILTLMGICLSVSAQSQYFKYTTNNGAITITKYFGQNYDVIIPSMITDLPVTSIGDNTFSTFTNLNSIVIPNSVTNIGLFAFHGCRGLSSITIPNSILTLGGLAFAECNDLTNVSIANGLITIKHGVFWSCKALTSINIPDSVTSIGDGAFTKCTSLMDVKLGNGVTTIGEDVFLSCTNLTNITIGTNLTTIGDNTFRGCFNLTSVKFEGNAPKIYYNELFSGANDVTVYYNAGTTGWGTTFAGRPTVAISSVKPSLKIKVKVIELTLEVTPTKKYQLEVSSDFNTWTKVGDVFTATSELIQEFDPIVIGRYYRLVELP